MVESGLIDVAHHNTNAKRALEETVELDKAVQVKSSSFVESSETECNFLQIQEYLSFRQLLIWSTWKKLWLLWRQTIAIPWQSMDTQKGAIQF